MNSISRLIPFVATLAFTHFVEARTYVPLAGINQVATDGHRTFLPINPESRPLLPGLRPVGVELLEDALRRKQPRTIGTSTDKAHASIIRNGLRSPAKRSHMKGMLAEAMYLEKNPNWGYVRKPNATQNDLYARLTRRKSPFTAQVKTHNKPDPAVYARDMLKDHRSNLFLVPDDHVAGLKSLWKNKIKDLQGKGLVSETETARRQLARIRSLGFTSQTLDSEFGRDVRYCQREQNSAYVSMAATLLMAFGPDLLQWMRTGSLDPNATARWVRSGAVLSAGGVATYSLKHIAKGSWRGSWKGNALVGSATLIADGFFVSQEYGGFQEAFRNPNFYCRTVGNLGGTALASVVAEPTFIYATAAASETGPFAPAIGAAAALVASSAAYAVGSIASESTTRVIFETISPESLHQAELKMVANTREDLQERIKHLQKAD